jgi:hypothetical protein
VELLEGLAVHLLVKFLWKKYESWRSVPPPSAAIEALEASQSVQLPTWVTNTPDDCFVGISRPCQSIEEARQQAIDSAISQVLQAMGADYNLTHESLISAGSDHVQHDLEERLVYTSNWFVSAVQQGIEESAIQQIQDRHVCFVLVRLSETKIAWFRKMTVGPKLAATIVESRSDEIVIEVRETSGVSATLTEYQISITANNRHASLITMFAWKVPESSNESFEGAIGRKCSLNGDSQTISIPCPSPDKNMGALLLGTERRIDIVLRGHDEIGRLVSVPVTIY